MTEAEAMDDNAEYDFHEFIDDGTGTCPRCGTTEGALEHIDNPPDVFRGRFLRPDESRYRGGDRPQPDRWRCLEVGCNPVLDEASAKTHAQITRHRVAKWPVRSPEGQRRARERNRTGYYNRYNVGRKSASARLRGGSR